MRIRALGIVAAAVALLGAVGIGRAEENIGWLDVASDPPAEIFIDEADTKLMTPQKHMPLAAGHHSLRLLAPDGKHSKIGFSVAAGKTTSLTMQPR
jgi:hypothetical protein